MLTKKDILEILKELIVNNDNNRLGLRYYDIQLDDTLVDDLGFDSLDVTDLSIALENKLKIRINETEVEDVMMKSNIETLINFLYEKSTSTPSEAKAKEKAEHRKPSAATANNS